MLLDQGREPRPRKTHTAQAGLFVEHGLAVGHQGQLIGHGQVACIALEVGIAIALIRVQQMDIGNAVRVLVAATPTDETCWGLLLVNIASIAILEIVRNW